LYFILFCICNYSFFGLISARIELSREESESHWQRNDYKSFNPSTDWEKLDFSKAQAIQEMPITSVICDPQPGETVKLDSDGHIRLRGRQT
jgi:sulfite oxidase